jgi:uncharacterized protein (TIGR00255 family)
MLNSMTGFARQVAESPSGTLTCEIRAVNHRYLDVQCRLPDELRAKEIEFRQQVGGTVRRGKVDCSVHFRRSEEGHGSLNQELIQQLSKRLNEIRKLLPDTLQGSPVSLIDVLRWPGVVDQPAVEEEPLVAATAALLSDTLAALAEMRASEGGRIHAMLTARCDEILAIAAAVRQRMPEVLTAVRARQQERIDKLDVEADPARLETELALIAQKLDVDEELDRLESHVSEIRDVIESDEPVGRRLDFLMQELNREANTLGSKSADTETTRAAVDLKVLIEQMREQIQNIE